MAAHRTWPSVGGVGALAGEASKILDSRLIKTDRACLLSSVGSVVFRPSYLVSGRHTSPTFVRPLVHTPFLPRCTLMYLPYLLCTPRTRRVPLIYVHRSLLCCLCAPVRPHAYPTTPPWQPPRAPPPQDTASGALRSGIIPRMRQAVQQGLAQIGAEVRTRGSFDEAGTTRKPTAIGRRCIDSRRCSGLRRGCALTCLCFVSSCVTVFDGFAPCWFDLRLSAY